MSDPVHADRAFVTVLAWPAAWDVAKRVEALALGAGVDPFQGKVAASLPTPAVVAMLDRAAAREAARALRRAGVPAFAPGQAEIDQVPAPVQAKRLAPALGAPAPLYFVEPWRGEAAGLNLDEVVLIVHGLVRRHVTVIERGEPEPLNNLSDWGFSMVAGPVEAAVTDAAEDLAAGPSRSRRQDRGSHVLDLYRLDGSRVRVDGSKFNFDVLGAQRGHSDAENSTRLAVLLGGRARQAEIDTGYSAKRVPAPARVRVTSARVEGTIRHDETPAFEFYSAWRYLVRRAILRSREPRDATG